MGLLRSQAAARPSRARCIRFVLLPALAICATAQLCPPALADNIYVVNKTIDDGSAGTLRWAVTQAAAAGPGTQTINFSLPTNAAITLASSLPVLNNVAGTIVINGSGALNLTINGNNTCQIFFVQSGNVSINNLNIINALSKGGNGGNDPLAGGGGGLGAGSALFVNQGAHVTVQSVNFNNNSAVGGNGGNLTGSGIGGGGGGGGYGGNGGDGAAQGGGGGGGFITNGGNGGLFAGGGGGGFIGNGANGGTINGGLGSFPGGNGGDAGANGAAGGNGGGGGGGGSSGNGGAGGDFGGGGAAGQGSSSTVGGAGGFGGGGGGNTIAQGGAGGFGGGNGGSIDGGDGGSGLGGAVFVRQGGTLTIVDANTANNSVTGGQGGGNFGATGQAAGQDLYVMSGVNANFGGTGSNFTGSISGAGGVTIQSTGTTTFGGANSYSGGTTVSSGTLSGNTTSLQGSITNNSAVLFNQATNGTYSGNMTGSGSLTKQGIGNVTLSGTNNYAGGTTVSGGTLTGTTTSLQGVITNNSQVVFNQNNLAGAFNGSLTGTGSVGINNGVVLFTATNNYGGGTTLTNAGLGGDTNSLQGSIQQDHLSVVQFAQSFDGTFSGTLSGSGLLYKLGSGSVSMTGTNTLADAEVEDGRLAVNGTLNGDVVVQNSGVLGGNGTINGNLYNYATVGPGNSIGTITVNGNYHAAAGSTQQVQIDANGSAPGVNNDLQVVNGTSTISGATVNVQAAPGTYTAGTKYTFLETNSLIGTYSGITGFSDPHVHAELGYGDIMVGSTDYLTAYFILVPNQSDFSSIAQTFNQTGVANYIDVNSLNATPELQAVIDSLNTLPVSQQQTALDAMTAQVNGTIAQLNVQDTTFLYMMLRRRAGSAFAANGLAGGSGDDGAFAMSGGGRSTAGATLMPVSLTSGKFAGDWGMPCASCRSCPTWGGWATGYGLGGNAGSDGNAAGGVYGSGGTIAAIERPLDDANLIGFFGAYSNLSVRLAGLPQSSSANQGIFGTYFLRDFGSTYFLVAGSAGFAGYRESRQMAFGSINSTAQGNYSGWNPSAYFEKGVRWQLGRTTLQPYGAMQYIYVRQNSFTETGAGVLDQSVGGINTHALRGILGSRLAQVWPTSSGTYFVPELRAAWMHEFLEPSSTLNAVFAPVGGGSFAAQGLNFGRDWALLGGGTQYVLNPNVSLFANYDLQFNVRQAWNAGSGGVQFAW